MSRNSLQWHNNILHIRKIILPSKRGGNLVSLEIVENSQHIHTLKIFNVRCTGQPGSTSVTEREGYDRGLNCYCHRNGFFVCVFGRFSESLSLSPGVAPSPWLSISKPWYARPPQSIFVSAKRSLFASASAAHPEAASPLTQRHKAKMPEDTVMFAW